MAEAELIYEVFVEGESPDGSDTPLYEADTAEGAKLACRTHFGDDGLGGVLTIYRRGREIATVRKNEHGEVVYSLDQGTSL
jgi:hypothetical protein